MQLASPRMLFLTLFCHHSIPISVSFRSFASQPKRFSRPVFRLNEQLYRADRVVSNRSQEKSRSECNKLLKENRIWEQQADGTFQLVRGPSQKLSMHAKLFVDKAYAIPLPPPLLMVYHKPKWQLSVRNDPHGRPCINEILPDMHPVGRLDYDTSGLLLFSSDGQLTQTLLHPKSNTPKEYQATVAGQVDLESLREKLADGVATSDGNHSAELLNATWMPSDQVQPYLQEIKSKLPYNLEDLDRRGHLQVLDSAQNLSIVNLVVTEGKYRMVRKLLANCYHPVVSLHRVKLGVIELGDLSPGETRDLTEDELAWARSLTRVKK